MLVPQSCLTLCDPRDYSLPGSYVYGIFQARILEWVAFPFSRELPNQGIEPRSPALQADSLPSEPPGKPLEGNFYSHIWDYDSSVRLETSSWVFLKFSYHTGFQPWIPLAELVLKRSGARRTSLTPCPPPAPSDSSPWPAQSAPAPLRWQFMPHSSLCALYRPRSDW